MPSARLSPEQLDRVAKALADPQRRRILECMAESGESCCSTMLERFEVTQATISHHLKELTVAGLLERRKAGQFAWYRFRADVLGAYTETLAELASRGAAPAAAPDRKKRRPAAAARRRSG